MLLAFLLVAFSFLAISPPLACNASVYVDPTGVIQVDSGSQVRVSTIDATPLPKHRNNRLFNSLSLFPAANRLATNIPNLLPPTQTAALLQNLDFPSRREALEKMLKIGILLHTIDYARDGELNIVGDRTLEGIRDRLSDLAMGGDHLSDDISLFHHTPPRTEYFIETHSGNFWVGDENKMGHPVCRKLYLSGANKYELNEAGSGVPTLWDGSLSPRVVGPEIVRRVMEEAVKQKLDFIRFNAFSVTPEWPSILRADQSGGIVSLTLNEPMMRGLDYVLDQARIHGLKVILVLTDYFADNAGGPLSYMNVGCSAFGNGSDACYDYYASDSRRKARFYGSVDASKVFFEYINRVVNRVNTWNGRVYRSDPVIMGWDIMNEPRCGDNYPIDTAICTNVAPSYISLFIGDAYNYLKALAVKQPITVGTDGYFSNVFGINPYAGLWDPAYPNGPVNPTTDESTYLSDFTELCDIVDFCEFNVYPDNWGEENEPWVNSWIKAHANVGTQLGKPVIVKEQGMQPTDMRKGLYKIMYEAETVQIIHDKDLGGGLRGAAYWQIWVKGQKAAAYTLDPGGRWGIQPLDHEVATVIKFSIAVGELSERKIDMSLCPDSFTGTSMLLPPPTCPRGYAGVDCVDVDECLLGLDQCSKNAACENTSGSYRCHCHAGYLGHGKVCTPQPIHLLRIDHRFYTKDTMSCVSGSAGVLYPPYAPGWAPDPTGYYDSRPSENRVPVTLDECKLACVMTEGECTSFYFDPIQGKCILKKNECPATDDSVYGCVDCDRPVCDAPNVSMCPKLVYVPDSSAPPTDGTYQCVRGITYFMKGKDYYEDNHLCPVSGSSTPPDT